nr:gluconokinase [Acetobacter garciniae]
MGVCGSGKSTVAEGLHNELGWPWQDADVLHSPQNRAKMAAGVPLVDQDRQDWLNQCHAWLEHCAAQGNGGILACSALKRAYRDKLRRNGLNPLFIYLHADVQVLNTRLEARGGHFMPASLLPSQLETLEPPAPDEDAWSFSTLYQPAETIAQILSKLRDPASRPQD